jgi:hypothetical protein
MAGKKKQRREYEIKRLGDLVTDLLEFMADYETTNGPVPNENWGAALAEAIRISTAAECGMHSAQAAKAGK